MRKCPRKKFTGGDGIVLSFFLYLFTAKKKANNPRSEDKSSTNIFFVADCEQTIQTYTAER